MSLCTQGYNSTVHKSHTLTPNAAHQEILDPWLRKQMYNPKKDSGLLPFDDFLRKELKLQKKLKVPRGHGVLPRNSQDWRINDLCLINFGTNRFFFN